MACTQGIHWDASELPYLVVKVTGNPKKEGLVKIQTFKYENLGPPFPEKRLMKAIGRRLKGRMKGEALSGVSGRGCISFLVLALSRRISCTSSFAR